MDLQKDIKKLVTYGLDKKLIEPEDEIYTINQYLEVFRLDEYEDSDIEGEEIILPEISVPITKRVQRKQRSFSMNSARIPTISEETASKKI